MSLVVKNEVLTDPKIGATFAAATTSTGIGTVLNLIPDNIGKLASLVGICFSIVLIVTHIAKWYMDHKKISLEIKALKDEQNLKD